MYNPLTIEDCKMHLTPFQGQVVVCKGVEDSVVISFAERVLNGQAATLSQLAKSVNVLKRYGCDGAAEALERKLARMRAAMYLAESMGFRRPVLRLSN